MSPDPLQWAALDRDIRSIVPVLSQEPRYAGDDPGTGRSNPDPCSGRKKEYGGVVEGIFI